MCVDEDVASVELLDFAAGNTRWHNSSTILETKLAVSCKVKHTKHRPLNATPEWNENMSPQKVCYSVLMAASFIMAKNGISSNVHKLVNRQIVTCTL